jgi:alkanesulfonate monooxygenase SsuD/methylene tetrahydromethanopterin reductase-like flavin-dependent oxidoreductase (luciferase family)
MAASTNPLRFGVNLTGPNRTYDELVATAKVAEDAGFDALGFTDRPPEPNFEAWTLATAIGVQTRRVLLTHNTLNVPFRNNALLAKMAASLDVITNGRLILTLGAGFQRQHFESYGIAFGAPGELYDDLKDAIEIVRGLWANERFSFRGRAQHVHEATVLPRPTNGSIPIFIGALGPRMLRLTGRVADGWLKNRGWPGSLDELRGLVAQLEEGADKAGRDPRTIHRVLNGTAALGSRAVEDVRSRAQQGPVGAAGLVGESADEILEIISEFREAGADTFHLAFPTDDRHDQIRAFGAEVIAKLRP